MISVIIPTCDRNTLLARCLEKLAPGVQSIETELYEVIVTDDSRGSQAKKCLQDDFPWVNWIEGPRCGPAANRNNGAQQAKRDWLIFLDDDCIPAACLLEEYANAVTQNAGIKVFEGCVKADREQYCFVEESPINETGGYLWSCNFMIKKGIFISMGGFDNGFPYPAMEDVEFHYRLCKAGIPILFVHSALVMHPWRIQKNIFSVTLKRFKSTLYFLKLHPEKSQEITSVYYLKISMKGLKTLFAKAINYRFRGFSGMVLFCILHFYFSIYILLYNLNIKQL